MSNSKEVQQYLLSKITLQDGAGEIESIVYTLLEHYFAVTHLDVLLNRPLPMSANLEILDQAISRINNSEPVQYVTGEAFFYRRKFMVNPAVLIPRPETEELVMDALEHVKKKGLHTSRILDLGTGSGCIPITLVLEIPGSTVMATDVSTDALNVARTNAAAHSASIEFVEHDMLSNELPFTDLDIITSNPPYIPQCEKQSMHKNVLDFEPHLALFVPDDDPLKFYKSIAVKSKPAMKKGGLLIVEVNEHHGHEVANLFTAEGYGNIEIIYDLAQKQRIVKGIKS